MNQQWATDRMAALILTRFHNKPANANSACFMAQKFIIWRSTLVAIELG